MLCKNNNVRGWVGYIFVLFTCLVRADPYDYEPRDLDLTFPIITESSEQHKYFLALLEGALDSIDQPYTITKMTLPQERAQNYLSRGKIDILWMLESKQRDEGLMPINAYLTNGMIGKRVFFIKPDQQVLFDRVESLQDLIDANLTAGLGASWYDVDVWRHNGLAVKPYKWNWGRIFNELQKDPELDYFPRGINEVITEFRQHEGLAIEENLLLVYRRDFKFYLPNKTEYRGIARIIEKL
jgi:hypothetical protein